MDLFSLGVLAFELWRPFGTAMERILTLKELRLRGEPPPDFRGAHPQVTPVTCFVLEHFGISHLYCLVALMR